MTPQAVPQVLPPTLSIAEARAITAERRRRPRLASPAEGYLWSESAPETDEPWEVRVDDVSRLGVGFTTTEPLESGALCRIRIGRGPKRLARLMRVTYCRPEGNLFRVGAEFA